ncbi:DNA-directed RNA polymerase beta' subunit [Bacillus phage AR9]|uniref:DNA-directed RNA polymerase n=1 Tax=Bacillus phage AR9 TaxID=1815509 RepID=A0A172JI62_BPPB1|nr:RNA polymerase beta subunit [Bacillus phage AR9]7S00_D Chain D, DNA-directed RNA polymerase [Bacillus phage AR9]7S00_F Chain F, DNA-directed RNA polymerase [Bacillus phage AR9]7S01_D Chain D, DNA-directed RNA polymerase [Bacillus phage AR9]7UM0_D Chain D, DNA-directed RNA polymerase [Bacillus phage AR9]7UM1_D Chain D, DNA-directed RNA polymerase [Bacillus phage AR9]AMS01238.1 DNA-directed RNA polymerase beta' subunit [Bacillus phage AR9]
MEKTYNLNDILLSNEYEKIKEDIKEEIINDMASKKVKYSNTSEFAKNDFLKDEFIDLVVDGETYEITYGNLITLLIVARPFNHFKVPMTEDLLFDLSDLKEYQNYYTTLLEHFGYSNEIKSIIKDVISELAIFSGDINVTFGNTVSIKSLIDLGNKVKRFRELLHYRLPNDEALEFNDIEAIIKKNLDEIMKILSETDNMLRYYIDSGAGINSKQFGQVLSLVGSKPDLFGKIIPYPINTSFLRGLDVRSFYINALGARKALITNYQQVRNSGYLTRKISMLLMDTKLIDLDDCGSHENNYLSINVENKDVLKRFSKRSYLNNNGELVEIDINDESLIGQVIKIPSPTTCASNEGVCRKCYGKLFDINKDLNIGMIAVLLLTDPLTQRLLSAKHLLETRSSKIDWGTNFEENFIVNRNLIYPKVYNGTVIIKEDDFKEDEETEEQVFDTFTLKSGNRFISISSPMRLFLNKDLKKQLDESFYNIEEMQFEIPLNKLDEGDSFATFIMDNNELSKPLREIKDLIETNKYIKDHNVNEVVNYFIYLLNESGINIQSVHSELIIREMMKLDDSDRTQFKNDKMPDYEIFRITDANLKGDSLSRSLLFEQVKKQLTTLDYDTFNKTKSSILDKLL